MRDAERHNDKAENRCACDNLPDRTGSDLKIVFHPEDYNMIPLSCQPEICTDVRTFAQEFMKVLPREAG